MNTAPRKPEIADDDAAAAYEEFLSEAQAIVDVQPYRLDPDVAMANVKTGMRVVAKHRKEIPEHLPRLDLREIESLGRLSLAVKFAAMAAERTTPSDRLVSQRLAEARQIRGTLLPVVAGLAATKLVPQSKYDDIVRGRGARDTAADCVALAQVFRDGGAALEGKHSADPEMIKKAAAVGSWLLQHVRPANARAEKAAPPTPAVEIRNRLATLLARRYSRLQSVAHYFHGDGWEAVAPPLMSRHATRAKKEPKATGSSAPVDASFPPSAP
ncbi:hypothetical protein [Sorangium sp. So ce1024]|uniref:hypothetical protein n=1 Tax=Sorangium sp. So ce1024 TaxID=3133327 RepID=UPI003F10B0CE